MRFRWNQMWLLLLGSFWGQHAIAAPPSSEQKKSVSVSPAMKEGSVFTVDPSHTYFQFTASTVLFDVFGQFHKYDVKVTGDPETLSDATVQVRIDVSSIDTAEKDRDIHLRGEDFFGVEKYPSIIFISNKIRKEGGTLIVQGKLTMHGVTKDITIPFDVVKGPNGAGVIEHVYRADLSIRRKDFGIGTDSLAAKISLKDEVQLHLILAGFFRPRS